jgi:uncharacterized Zn-binding protein involved in type VI secretion
MPPAARITDMHTCPMVTPGVPPIPHVGGPVIVGCPTVLIGFMPAARVSDTCICVGPPDTIAKGSMTVFIGGMPAARMGDLTMHGGVIVMGCPTVMIGDAGAGGGGSASVKASAPKPTTLLEHGHWCGPDRAPALQAGLESQIPADESTWSEWVTSNSLPAPSDGVDRVCMLHDLRLGKLRQQNPDVTFSSGNFDVAKTHAKLMLDFASQAANVNNPIGAQLYAARGGLAFVGLSAFTAVGGAVGAAAAVAGAVAGAVIDGVGDAIDAVGNAAAKVGTLFD